MLWPSRSYFCTWTRGLAGWVSKHLADNINFQTIQSSSAIVQKQFKLAEVGYKSTWNHSEPTIVKTSELGEPVGTLKKPPKRQLFNRRDSRILKEILELGTRVIILVHRLDHHTSFHKNLYLIRKLPSGESGL